MGRYSFHRNSDEVEQNGITILTQLLAIGVLGLTALFVWAVEHWWPDFYNHPNLNWSVTIDNVLRFWPLLVYCTILTGIFTIFANDRRADGRAFGLAIIISVLAGIWEELGYRWIFICTAMIGIVFMNWLLGTFFGLILIFIILVLGAVVFYLSISSSSGATVKIIGALSGLATIASSIFLFNIVTLQGHDNPMLWFYGTILVPVINFITLGNFKHILYNPNLPQLFVFGIIAANAKFRDGHKYQGPVGMLNAWVIGLIMMHATITYGLGTAIAVHAIYDICCFSTRFIVRRISG